jgi:maleylpyruvate isomerase
MMRLFSYWRSSSAWRVRIALQLKRVDCTIIPVHLVRGGGEQFRSEFLARNPQGQVPVLEVDGAGPPESGGVFRLTQSMAILEYLEETRPAPPLLPRPPELRARARQLAEVVNSGTQPYQNLRLQNAIRAAGADPAPLVKEFNELGLAALEELAAPAAGRFLLGDELSIADVLLVPQLYGARRNGVDVEAYPTLRRVERVCEALPEFAAAHPDAQPDCNT